MSIRLLIALLLSQLFIASPAMSASDLEDNSKEKTSKQEKIKKKPQSTKDNESKKNPKSSADEIDWGYWNKKPDKDGKQYGVGIKGKLEAQLNSLDESSLVDDPSGVLLDEEMENDI